MSRKEFCAEIGSALLCIAAFVLLMIVAHMPASAAPDSFRTGDKILHAGAGGLIAAGFTEATGSWKWGMAAGCAAGALKELSDRGGAGEVSGRDFIATCAGAAIGAALTWHFVVVPRKNGKTVTVGFVKDF
jgi:hypothetical protein